MYHGYHGSFYGYKLFFYDMIKTFGLDSAIKTSGELRPGLQATRGVRSQVWDLMDLR